MSVSAKCTSYIYCAWLTLIRTNSKRNIHFPFFVFWNWQSFYKVLFHTSNILRLDGDEGRGGVRRDMKGYNSQIASTRVKDTRMEKVDYFRSSVPKCLKNILCLSDDKLFLPNFSWSPFPWCFLGNRKWNGFDQVLVIMYTWHCGLILRSNSPLSTKTKKQLYWDHHLTKGLMSMVICRSQDL